MNLIRKGLFRESEVSFMQTFLYRDYEIVSLEHFPPLKSLRGQIYLELVIILLTRL